jgi:hypothetical protein
MAASFHKKVSDHSMTGAIESASQILASQGVIAKIVQSRIHRVFGF